MLIVKYILNFSSQFSSISVLNHYIPLLMKYHHVHFVMNNTRNKSNTVHIFWFPRWKLAWIGTTGCDTKMISGSWDSPIVSRKNTLYACSIHIPRLWQGVYKNCSLFVNVLKYWILINFSSEKSWSYCSVLTVFFFK